jgi:hypothetical protein
LPDEKYVIEVRRTGFQPKQLDLVLPRHDKDRPMSVVLDVAMAGECQPEEFVSYDPDDKTKLLVRLRTPQGPMGKVTVRLMNAKTGEAFLRQTNDAGELSFATLNAGHYHLTVAAPVGFREVEVANFFIARETRTTIALQMMKGDAITICQ